MQMNRSFVFALTAVLFWSTVGTAFKLTLRHVDPFQMLFYASLTAVVTLFIILLVQGRTQMLLDSFVQHWRITVMAGLLNPFLYYIVLFEAYDRLPAQVAQPINYTWAMVLMLLSIVVLKQNITRQDIQAAFICYGGVLIIATQGDLGHFVNADWFGIFLAVISTVIWATYWIINIHDQRNSTVSLCLNFMIAMPMIAIACGLMSEYQVSISGFIGSVYIGLFEMALPFLAWSYALKLSVNSSRVGNLIFLSPIISLILFHHILGEKILISTCIGLVLILGSLVYQQYSSRTD